MFEEPTPEEEAFAEDLVRDAMRGVDTLLSKDAYRAIFDLLVDELLCTPEGQSQLRRAMSDPTVARSAEVARLRSGVDAAKKARSGR